jgi:hypothetical protein
MWVYESKTHRSLWTRRYFLVIMFLMDQVQGEDFSEALLAGMRECAGRNLERYRHPARRR